MSFETLPWSDRFVRELPGDPDPSNRSRQVYDAAYSRVSPTPVPAPVVLAWSPEVAAQLGIAASEVRSEAFAQVFGGNRRLPGMTPYAACYGGHQFGQWAGQLGDGRAITLGEVSGLDLQLKGAGPTPYSRHADGRAVLRSSVREFLCSEAMSHLGVPTTRALSLVATGERVVRDMFYDGHPRAEPGAVVCRVAPSFLRFGSFELPARRNDTATLQALVSHTLGAHFSELGPVGPQAVVALLAEVARRTARMVAGWMRVGFVHGVMNTDNMSVLGLTIDYGPYGWIDGYDPDWTPNTTDAGQRRYRFGHQSQVAGWNLVRLAEALYPLVGDVDAVQGALGAYEETWTESRRDLIASKLGLSRFCPPIDEALWTDLDATLRLTETDMTLFFRGLARVRSSPNDDALLAPIEPAFYVPPPPAHRAAWLRWLRSYLLRVAQDDRSDEARSQSMDRCNPLYVLRNYLAQLAIDRAEAGDPDGITELLDVLRTPYTEQPHREAFAARRPEWARHRPGCSELSCSS